jgi:uncharacterized protein (DUF4415 family)
MKRTVSKPAKTINDNPRWAAKNFARAKPLRDVLPDLAAASDEKRGRGRPKVAHPKESITLRLDHDVVEAFRATGEGWHTRINDTLARHKPKKVA